MNNLFILLTIFVFLPVATIAVSRLVAAIGEPCEEIGIIGIKFYCKIFFKLNQGAL